VYIQQGKDQRTIIAALAICVGITFGSATTFAFGNCTDAEVIETNMERIMHNDCMGKGDWSDECIEDEEILCKDLQLVQRTCHVLTVKEEQALRHIRNNGVSCNVPNH